MKAYHFTGNKLRGGSPIPPIGETLKFEGELVLCESGLHASKHPFDALQYAPGEMLHRVRLGGEVIHEDDKTVGRERTIIATINATDLLRKFARMCASDVLHLWKPPEIVKHYLKTGDESIRETAWDAAWDAARSATCDAARSAAHSAEWASEREIVKVTEWASARATAWNVARRAANAAARAASWDAANAAAWAASWDAAGAASWAKQCRRFARMVSGAFRDA